VLVEREAHPDRLDDVVRYRELVQGCLFGCKVVGGCLHVRLELLSAALCGSVTLERFVGGLAFGFWFASSAARSTLLLGLASLALVSLVSLLRLE